ncbi:polysaccharide biosynthesis protein [Pseudomonadota bacterium]
MKEFEGKNILITGGTGSLGKFLLRRLLSGENGNPKSITIFSRDEAKQHFLRLSYLNKEVATDEVIFQDFKNRVKFVIGDIRDYPTVVRVLKGKDIVFNAAALKQVPSCEYFPFEAVKTNIIGADNVVKAITENDLSVKTVIGISTDKAAKPVNVMGMTKAIQERIFESANLITSKTRFIKVRYGNVLASRGSVIPLFYDQIKTGGPVTVTTEDMTRFLLSLDKAVDTIFAAYNHVKEGETLVPKVPSSKITNIAKALIGDRKIDIKISGIRPGEKVHEILISEEEKGRVREISIESGNYYIIGSALPELINEDAKFVKLDGEYSSNSDVMNLEETISLLKKNKLMFEDCDTNNCELLR